MAMSNAVFIAFAAFTSFDDCVAFSHQNDLYDKLPEQCVKLQSNGSSYAPYFTPTPPHKPNQGGSQ